MVLVFTCPFTSIFFSWRFPFVRGRVILFSEKLLRLSGGYAACFSSLSVAGSNTWVLVLLGLLL